MQPATGVAIRHLRHTLSAPEQTELRRALAVWIHRVILQRFSPAEREPLPPINHLEEVESMLAERIEQWGRELQQTAELRGEQRGEQRGERRGERRGEQQLLSRMLTLRFGTLPEWAVQRLGQADVGQLERWGERLITAPDLSLRDLLEEP